MTTQTKADSLKETLTNVGIGMVGSWVITLVVLQFLTNPLAVATVTTIACTVWSIGRGYTVRRYFNKQQEAE
jgi:hypothetical protein